MTDLFRLGEVAGETMVRLTRWIFPHTVTAKRDDLGTLLFQVGWLGYPIVSVTYFTPLGEIPHDVPEQVGYQILNAADWVDALCLVHDAENPSL